MEENNLPELDNLLPFQLYRLGRLLRHYLQQKQRAQGYEFTPEQFFIVYRVYSKNGLSQRELADKVLQDHPNITRLIDKLEKEDFLKREDDPHDRRNYIVRPSAKGREIFQQAIPLIHEEHNKVLEGISEEEVEIIQKIIKKIEHNLRM
ncbi:MAG: MarR family transcriptional regulator [Syntrophaceae bacterium]|jgi:MarR family transcriptional regulator, transcriptional regulator for hemolysin|nr:MarR family transcriptional regulator [Syntrophaceae bacterium]HOC60594.1 MarR family transcriptional regulator [Smithellaceae bacterium]HQM44540.1 MarR family transcriptional regulator [Smithellaceae bacterium]